MPIVKGTVVGALIAVSSGTSVTSNSGVDELQVDVILNFGIIMTESFNKTI